MDILKKHEDRNKRLSEVAKIINRIAEMEKKTKTSRRQFCITHDIHTSYLSKVLNYKLLPEWPMLKKVSDALSLEGF